MGLPVEIGSCTIVYKRPRQLIWTHLSIDGEYMEGSFYIARYRLVALSGGYVEKHTFCFSPVKSQQVIRKPLSKK